MFTKCNMVLSFILLLFLSTTFSQKILYPIVHNSLWGYIDSSGTEIIAPQYIQAGPFSNGLAFVKKGLNTQEGTSIIDDIGYINTKNEFRSISGFFSGFDEAENFYEERAAARLPGIGILTNSKWGFIDTSLNTVIEPVFTKVGNFSEGLAWVEEKKNDFFICNFRQVWIRKS